MKSFILGTLLVVSGASMALTQVDTTKSTPPAYPDSMQDNTGDDHSGASVRRAVICSGVSNHEPTDSLATLPSSMGKVFFFTEITGLEGKTITHRWIKDGAKVADIRISVASNRYRCHSSRSVAGKTGNWTVQVLNEDGDRLVERTFTVGTPSADSPVGKT
ncbi:MAG TPA: DUF2914 domain-containing protein [Candidatus Krumholzibacteria bacterium]